MISNVAKKFFTRAVSSGLGVVAAMLLFSLGAQSAWGQACAPQNWAAATPNVWASEGGVKVMLNNNASTNQPVIPIFADDGG